MTLPTDSRYSRQSRFAPLGPEGQARIQAASVAIVGCGALGTVEAEILARAGVGRIRIIDRDFVECSNLQRQFLFEESDAGEGLPKAVAAARRLARVNSEVAIEPMVADLTPANIEDLFEGVGLILDGTRYVRSSIPGQRLRCKHRDSLGLRCGGRELWLEVGYRSWPHGVSAMRLPRASVWLAADL